MTDRKQALKLHIKERGLVPNPFKVGDFIRPQTHAEDNKINFLYPNTWVFHQDVVQKVLQGDYQGIMPYSGEFVPTMNCSCRCSIPCAYMPQKKMEGIWDANDLSNPRVHMQSLEFAKSMIDKLKAGGLKGLIFTGGGEPLIYEPLEDLLAYTTSQGIDAVLYTNGNQATPERVKKICRADPLLVRVSLNCGTKETYDKLHHPLNPGGAFERTLQAITGFAEHSYRHPAMSTGVAVVFNKINAGEVVDVALRVREIVNEHKAKIDFIAYRPAFYCCSTQALDPKFLDRIHDTIETRVRPILADTDVQVSNVTQRYEILKDTTRFYDECRASGLFMELGPTGELHLCCDLNCHPHYVIGDLKSSTLQEIWKGNQRLDLLKRVNEHRCTLCPPGCKPHSTNNQFADVERLRATDELYKVEVWIEEQTKLPSPKMVNF